MGLFYGHNQNRGINRGYLYNAYSALDVNFAPTDWKVPSDEDYKTLEKFLGMSQAQADAVGNRGTDEGSQLAGYENLWIYGNLIINANFGVSGFNAKPTGYRATLGTFNGALDNDGRMWAAESGSMTYRTLLYNRSTISRAVSTDNRWGFAVRLLYTGVGTPTSLIDYDGNTYNVVNIGTQYWLTDYWKCTHLTTGTSLTKITSDATWAAATAGNLYYCAYDNDEANV